MAVLRKGLVSLLAVASASARSIQPRAECPGLPKGSVTIDQYQLYPENADWDVANCLVYFG